MATVVSLASAPSAGAQTATFTRVTGTVFDSVAMRPLAGALVQFADVNDPTRARSAVSGSDGRFQFDSVSRGVYAIGFFHFRLDSVVPSPPQLTMVVRDSAPMTVPLGIPSATSMIVATCGGTADDVRGDGGRGLFSGTVRNAGRLPVGTGGRVRLQWSTLVVDAKSIRREPQTALAETDSAGHFAVCGVPAGGRVTARAWTKGDSSGFAEFEIPASGYASRDLYVPASLSEGTPGIRGTVRNARSEAVAGARIRVWGSDVEAVSNAAGQFSLDAPPAGTQTIELRAVGYEPRKHVVDVLPGGNEELSFALAPLIRLDTVKVTGTRIFVSLETVEFESRKRGGFGRFLDQDDIARRKVFSTSDHFRTMPGMLVTRGRYGEEVLMRGANGPCIPSVFVDGLRVEAAHTQINELIPPHLLLAVEAYTSRILVPPQFQTLNGCGSLVLWTKQR